MEARPPARTRTRTVSCPNCGGSIEIRAAGLSVSAICASCGATVDVASPDIRLISEAQARTRQPPIAIGARAQLVGTLWEVVGYQVRSNPAEGWTWDEYLLFNPYEGFRFLVSDEDDWMLYAMLPRDVPDPSAGAGDGRHYHSLDPSRARTEYVLGEFYWRVRVGDEVTVAEYADPPFMLSQETNAAEVTWSRGIELPADMVGTAFNLPKTATPPTTLDRANTRRADTRAVLRIGAAALILLIMAAIVPFGISHDVLLFQQDFQTTVADRGRPVSTAEFTVPGSGGNLWIGVRSPVRNAWAEFGFSLVNVATARTFDADVTVEEYEGTDSDGAWSEGGQANAVTFKSVPGGSYKLLIDTDALAYGQPGSPATRPVSFTVAIRRHVPSQGFFWIAVLLLLVYPVWRVVGDRLYYATRWKRT